MLSWASSVAQQALTLARNREQPGDAAAALRVLGDAAARDPLDIDKAEHHYRAAIGLAGELEMRPLLARGHLGIGRLSTPAVSHLAERAVAADSATIPMISRRWAKRPVSGNG
jgi:hypothetical protein